MNIRNTLLTAIALGTIPMALAQCPDSTAILFNSDFENDDGGLVTSGFPDWQHGVIGTSLTGTLCTSTFNNTIGAHSGTSGWGTILADCYNNSGDTSVVGLTVDLSDPAYTAAELRFWHWFEVFTNFDFLFIRVNGQQVWLNNSTQFSQVWLQQAVDLTPFLGQSVVNITFHLYATTVVNKAGWYLDDMQVTACIPSGSVGLAGLQGRATSIGPNPAEEVLWVTVGDDLGDVRIWRMMDAGGRVVRQGGPLVQGSRTGLEVSLPTGLYLLELQGEKGQRRERVVIR